MDAPTTEAVENLSVQVVTGETCYSGEGGFSSISAEFTPKSPEQAEIFERARINGSAITIRCAMLDVTGTITKRRGEGNEVAYVLPITDMNYRRPS